MHLYVNSEMCKNICGSIDHKTLNWTLSKLSLEKKLYINCTILIYWKYFVNNHKKMNLQLHTIMWINLLSIILNMKSQISSRCNWTHIMLKNKQNSLFCFGMFLNSKTTKKVKGWSSLNWGYQLPLEKKEQLWLRWDFQGTHCILFLDLGKWVQRFSLYNNLLTVLLDFLQFSAYIFNSVLKKGLPSTSHFV